MQVTYFDISQPIVAVNQGFLPQTKTGNTSGFTKMKPGKLLFSLLANFFSRLTNSGLPWTLIKSSLFLPMLSS